MKNIIIHSTLIIVVILAACKAPQKSTVSSIGENIGASIEKPDPIDFVQLMNKMSQQDTVKTHLKAKVEGVCQVKGCWMNLVPTEGTTDESIFVKFKDYAFFMPLDLAGSEVIVDGIAYREVTSVDELRHYAEDEGKTAEEIALITEPAEELKFMADGVIILK